MAKREGFEPSVALFNRGTIRVAKLPWKLNPHQAIDKQREQMKPKNKEEEKVFMKVIIQTVNAKIMLGQMNVSANEKILLEQLLKKYIS